MGRDNQGITYTTKCVIYLDENAEKQGSDEYEEYTLSEFTAKYPAEANKIVSLRNSVAFDSFVSAGNGTEVNCTVIESIGVGNIEELVSSCAFDELKWNYLLKRHSAIYNP